MGRSCQTSLIELEYDFAFCAKKKTTPKGVVFSLNGLVADLIGILDPANLS